MSGTLLMLSLMTHLSLLDNHVFKGPLSEGDEVHVALHHIEELLALLQVKVLPLVGPAHEKHL